MMRVLEFQREGWRNAAKALRKIADDLEAGKIEPCSVGILAMRSEKGGVETYGFGPKADGMQSLALFRLGEQKLIDVLLSDA